MSRQSVVGVRLWLGLCSGVLILLLLMGSRPFFSARAAEPEPEQVYTIVWYGLQVDSDSQGGDFSLVASPGQANPAPMQGGAYAVSGNTLPKQIATEILPTVDLFLPIISR